MVTMPTSQLPIWVQYIQALGTPIAAFIFGAITALISYKQYRTSVHRFRLDLYERRYKVYVAIQDIFGEILREDKISDEAYSKFVDAIRDARFIFGDEVKAYIDKLIDLIFEKRKLERRINERANNDRFDEWYDELERNWDAMTRMMKEVAVMFSKYLKMPR